MTEEERKKICAECPDKEDDGDGGCAHPCCGPGNHCFNDYGWCLYCDAGHPPPGKPLGFVPVLGGYGREGG